MGIGLVYLRKKKKKNEVSVVRQSEKWRRKGEEIREVFDVSY